ncbi:MAG: hypothetical protein KC457_35965, partial [Myxococcales bacterium]|nr:hypothetical protein [Myxococcales bacterium]
MRLRGLCLSFCVLSFGCTKHSDMGPAPAASEPAESEPAAVEPATIEPRFAHLTLDPHGGCVERIGRGVWCWKDGAPAEAVALQQQGERPLWLN